MKNNYYTKSKKDNGYSFSYDGVEGMYKKSFKRLSNRKCRRFLKVTEKDFEEYN